MSWCRAGAQAVQHVPPLWRARDLVLGMEGSPATAEEIVIIPPQIPATPLVLGPRSILPEVSCLQRPVDDC